MKIADSSVVSRSGQIAQRLFEEQMLVITVEDSKLHRFNETATFIWQCIETPKRVGEIIDAVGEQFDIDNEKESAVEVKHFIEAMAEKGLVEISPE
jgi:hypothetical protein